MSRSKLQYIILGLLLFCALNAQLAYTGVALYFQANPSRYVDLPFYVFDETLRISATPKIYENSGLQVNDEILALNGEPLTGLKMLAQIRFSLRPGDSLLVKVSRTVKGQRRFSTYQYECEASIVIHWIGQSF